MITKEQFCRGMQAVMAYNHMISRMEIAAADAGCRDVMPGFGNALEEELVAQLCERCNDLGDYSLIKYMLYEGDAVQMLDGRVFTVESPERAWAFWAASKTGPFAGGDEK